ncbi:MAG: hypothetical protein HUU01_06735 [Saprospiraceae bacterium]|nr:hypothetical protein [Saprospiraceae bacterium]
MKFPPPENIEINEERSEGQVTGIGIPITNWTEESRIKIAGYLLNYPTFYINNKAMAVANILCAMAGFASDTSFINTHRDNFGGVKGEVIDYKGSFSKLIDYVLPGKFDRDHPERNKVIAQTTTSLKKDLKDFFKLPEVEEALHLVARSVLVKEKDSEGYQRIEKEELVDLNNMVQGLTVSRIKNLKELIAKYVDVDAGI